MAEATKKLPITLVIITKNEESNIEPCIASVPFVDEVIVVDSESTDLTVEKARKLGAKVIQKPWMGFQAQKQFATDQAKNEWVLSLDADERLSEELVLEIEELFKAEKTSLTDAYAFPRISFHLGRWIRYGGWYPDYQKRLYNKMRAHWAGNQVHEYLEAKQVHHLKKPIKHFVFKSLSHQIQTNDRYSTLGAESLISQGQRLTLPYLIFKPWIKFIECYIYKLGFLDGRAGFIIAVGAAYSIFLKYAKVWESQIEKAPYE